MPIVNGKYVNPGWVNGAQPYINASELNDISTTLEQLPIANGGTGATTASAALTNLGAEPKTNVTSKGSNELPVYFDANGVATPITVLTTPLSDFPALSDFTGTISKFGKLVMITATLNILLPGGYEASGVIPSGYRPVQQAYGMAFGIRSTSASAAPICGGIVSINTSGSIRLERNEKPSIDESLYLRFSITYVSA